MIERWHPLPEEFIHRGERIALAVASPSPGLVAVLALDDGNGTTCGFNLTPHDARAVAVLLERAADDAERAQASEEQAAEQMANQNGQR
jgi:hypothetical protein